MATKLVTGQNHALAHLNQVYPRSPRLQTIAAGHSEEQHQKLYKEMWRGRCSIRGIKRVNIVL